MKLVVSPLRLRDMKTSVKLIGAFLILFFLLVVVGGVSFWAMNQLNGQIRMLSSQNMPKIERLSQIRQALRSTRGDLSQAILEPDYQVALRDLALVNDDELYLLGAVTHYQALSHSMPEEQGITEFQYVLYPWLDTLHTIEPLAQEHTDTDHQQIITILDTQWLPEATKVDTVLGHLIDLDQRQADTARVTAEQSSAQLGAIVFIVIVGAFCLALLFGMLLSRLIVQPLRQLVIVTQAVARGELVEMDDLVRRFGGYDEPGQVIHAFHSMLGSLRHLLGRVRETSHSISRASAHIGDSYEHSLADRDQHTSSFDQLAQAVAEIDDVEQLSIQLATAYQELSHTHVALQDAHETIQQQALTDPLTDLPNHRALLAQIEKEVERAYRSHRSFAVIFFDGDRFKSVNDTYGHAVGDVVLRQLGERANSVLRGGDTLGRFGGEEFVALLPEIDLPRACTIAERMREAIAAFPLALEQVPGGIHTSISVGVALYPDDGVTANELLLKADQAMYWAKKLGRNQVRTTDDVRRASNEFAVKDGADDEREESNRLDGESYAHALQADRWGMLASLTELLELRDPHTHAHSQEVSKLAEQLAREMGLNQETIVRITTSALLHDIGKVGIPDNILRKAGQLTTREWVFIKQHPEMGEHVITPIAGLRCLTPAIRHHHERWDGSGYPDGLVGEHIPLEARIIAVADAFQVMTTERSYQTRRTISEALMELQRCAGSHFDPAIVMAFVKIQTIPEQAAA